MTDAELRELAEMAKRCQNVEMARSTMSIGFKTNTRLLAVSEAIDFFWKCREVVPELVEELLTRRDAAIERSFE